MQAPEILLYADTDPVTHVEIRRGPDVPDAFWLRLAAEVGGNERRHGSRIRIGAEAFLTFREALHSLCRQNRVAVRATREVATFLALFNREKALLAQAVRGVAPVPESEVMRCLAGSRFHLSLRPFQLRDLAHLLALEHGANFSVPGAGKTAVTYALYEAERVRGRVSRLLVVAPLSAFDAWVREANSCFSSPPVVAPFKRNQSPADVEVLLVNYQRLNGNYGVLSTWAAAGDTHVVLDEGHRMKRGREGQWGSASLNLAYHAVRRDVLTGTPAPQSPLDLVALLDFTWPIHGRSLVSNDVRRAKPSPDAMQQLSQRIRPLFVRTRKSELELKEPDLRVEPVPLKGLHKEIYRALLNQYSGVHPMPRQSRAVFAAMGKVTMYLLQAASNPALLTQGPIGDEPIEFHLPPLPIPPGSKLPELLEHFRLYETPAKFAHLGQMVRENAEAGRKTLVWSNFVRNLTTLRKMMQRLQPAVIHGGVPSEVTGNSSMRTRERELERFREDPNCMVLLANPAAMSEGVSLHDVCHDAIYLDRTFNAGHYLQSIDRIHRLGLKPGTETRIRFLVTQGTIDDVVDRRVKDKAGRLSLLLDDPDIITMALPSDDDYGAPLDTVEDLVALFQHLKGEDAMTRRHLKLV